MSNDTLTENEAAQLAEIIAHGIVDACDARDDARIDADPLLDSHYYGARVSDGFEMESGA